MSWILGCLTNSLTENICTKLASIHARELYRCVTGSIYISAGGIKETCQFKSFDNGSTGWVVCGLGVRATDTGCNFLSGSDWGSILSDAQPNLKSIDGHFVACRWKDTTFEIFTDQLGLRTMYLVKTREGMFFSTRLDWITKLSSNALIDFATLGGCWLAFNQLSYASLIQGVQKLGPSGYAKLTEGSMLTHCAPWEPKLLNTSSELVERHVKALSRPNGEFANISLGLSGGLDSRVLLALMLNANQRPSVHTFGPLGDPDVYVPKRIASDEGLTHQVFHEPLPTLSECIALMQDYAAQACLCEPATSILKLRSYSSLYEQEKLLMDGGFGEISRRQYFNRLLVKGRTALLSGNPHLISPFLYAPRADIFTADVNSLMRKGLEEQIETTWKEMPSFTDIGIENFLDLLAVRTRIPNWGGLEQPRIDGHILNYMPFVQPSLLNLVFSLTPRMRVNGYLFRYLIKKNRTSLTKYPLVKGNTTYPFPLTTMQSWLWTKVKSRLGLTFRDNSRTRVLDVIKEFVLDTLESTESRSYAPYNYEAINRMVHSYYRGRSELSSQVDWWVTFELWRRSVKSY